MKELDEDDIKLDEKESDKKKNDKKDAEKQTKPINITLCSVFAKEAENIADVFPEFSEELFNIGNAFKDTSFSFMDKNNDFLCPITKEALPGQKYLGYQMGEDAETAASYKKNLDDYGKLLDKMMVRYKKKGTEDQKIMLQVLKNNVDLVKSDSFMEDVSGFSEYYNSFVNFASDLPSILYKKKEYKNEDNTRKSLNDVNQDHYKQDPVKFEKIMDKFKLLDHYTDIQKFYITEYLPNKKAREEGPIINDAGKYNKKYRDLLSRQKKMLTQKLRFKSTNRDMVDNRRIEQDPEYFVNLSDKKNFTNERLKTIDFELKAMDRGWPAVDMQFLREVDKMKNYMEVTVADTDNINQRKECQKVLDAMKEPYNRIANSYVTSNEQRLSLIEDMEPAIKEYARIIKEYNQANYNPQEVKFADAPIIKTYQDAYTNNVSMIEIGVNPLKITTVDKENGRGELNGFTIESVENNINIMLEDLKKVDPKTVSSSNQFIEMKRSLKGLADYVKELKQNYPNDEAQGKDAYMEFMSKFKERANQTKDLVETYLNYKNEQLQKGGRRNSWMKQFREQPRIDMAINTFDKLGYMTERIDYLIEKQVGFGAEQSQKNFYERMSERINQRNTYRGMMTSKQRVKKTEDKKNEIKAKKQPSKPTL
ncbi:hypothetical protein SAMN02910369_00698 [Lachnospiraceae bacterium NE2001]|nr:hypothetical protein SAMN02910369_00698 [Lachnospiraceae bacterium NE2001]